MNVALYITVIPVCACVVQYYHHVGSVVLYQYYVTLCVVVSYLNTTIPVW
jgi:hypothetical protein